MIKLFLILLVSFLSACFLLFNSYPLILIVPFVISIFLFKKSHVLILMYVFFAFMFFIGVLGLLGIREPQILQQVDDVLTYFLLFYSLVNVRGISRVGRSYFKFLIPVVFFVLVSAVSALVNLKYTGNVIKFVGYNIEPFVFLLTFAVLDLPLGRYKKLIKFVVVLCLIQAVIGILQVVTFDIFGSRVLIDPKVRLYQDIVTGTLCSHGVFGSHLMGNLMLIIFSLFIYAWAILKKNLFGFIAFILAFVFVMTYTETAYIFVPFLILPLFIARFISLKTKLTVLLLVIVAFAGFLFYAMHVSERYAEVLGKGNWRYTGKVQSYVITKDMLLDNPINFTLGYGPASISSDSTDISQSYLYRKLFGVPKAVASTINVFGSSVITLFMGVGIIGALFYLLPFFLFLRMSYGYLKNSNQLFQIVIYSWWFLFTLQIFFMSFLFNVFERDIFPHLYLLLTYYCIRFNLEGGSKKDALL